MSGEVQNYNTVSRVFHWSVAFLILGLLIAGFFMADMGNSPLKFKVYGWHKALGMSVLVLGVLRIVWKHVSKSPSSLTTHKRWEKILSKTIHIVLYLLIIAMPFSGWVMSSAAGYPVTFFGLFEFPSVVGKDKELSGLANELHTILAFVIIGGVGLHIIGALKHHVIDKDLTLTRMGGYLVFGVLGLLALGAALVPPVQNLMHELTREVTAEESVSDESGHDSHEH